MDGLTPQANLNRDRISDIRSRLQRGLITYEAAQLEAQPVIDAMNQRGKEISKEDGFTFKPLTFKYLMR